ncbi:MAG: pyruvate dehydrogenase complex dihydrolipoamide acetyltransferase [Pseudarcicella sp.]|nr:pyruvate dehydrogenase complex dihydrolipoamide acetyltransferase [Pseudarcicella sp.]
MAVAIRMPKMSDTMTEGVIADWLKKVGDTVKSGDIIAEVETDKATMELENYEDGVLLYIGIEKGQSVPVDGVIAVIGTAGEDYQTALGADTTATAIATPSPSTPAETAPVAVLNTTKVNAVAVRMPKMSDTMTEGVIAEWLKKVGDVVKNGDIIAEVETDKATMELENYEDGTLLYIGAEKGKGVPVDGIIAIVGEPGADFNIILANEGVTKTTSAPAETPSPAPAPAAVTTAPVEKTNTASHSTNSTDERLKASPLAKVLAKEKGIQISAVKGTGENGRIIKADIENFTPAQKTSAASSPSAPQLGTESYEDLPVNQMRKTIARRLSESKFTAPSFYLTMEINMDNAMSARTSMNEISPVKISFNDMVIKAVAAALTKHPKINSYWMGDKIRVNHHVNIGMAVAVEDGLLVPVIRFANTKTLSQISAECKDLGGKAKNKQLQPKDWEGNTFTVSNLGMFGIEEFTSIINQPESCILAVGGIKETVGVKNGQFYATNVMKVTLTCDHRTVDGAMGAAFLQTFKQLLEDPIKLLV